MVAESTEKSEDGVGMKGSDDHANNRSSNKEELPETLESGDKSNQYSNIDNQEENIPQSEMGIKIYGSTTHKQNASTSNSQDVNSMSLNTNTLSTQLEIAMETSRNLDKGTKETNQPDKRFTEKFPRRMSNYLINITNSNVGLTLTGGEKKDSNLLADSKTVIRFSPIWKQALASAPSILLTLVSGMTSGYSAILLPQLKHSNGPIPYDDDTASWIAAIAALPMAAGCLIAGWMMERYGRRATLYITCLPMFLGWIFIACAYNLSLMLIGRFLTGICAGILGPLTPVYIGETTEPKYRGFFLAAISLAVAVGIMIVQLIGTYASWQWTAIICCICPLISLVLLTLIPESPIWLISQNRLEDAVKAYYSLRGYGDDAKVELKAIIDNKKVKDEEPKMNMKEKLQSLKNPEFIKPLFTMIIFFVTCQFSGVNAIAFYSVEIVEKAVGQGIDHYTAMLIIDALRVVMSVVSCVLSKRYGRRPLCFISGVWTAISMAGLAMFLYWKPENMAWLPLMCLLFYICAISIGLVPLPWIMCGEVFPTRVRGLGSGISSATTFIAFFIVVKTAPAMMSNLGEVITFLLYGVISLLGTVVMYFILPETKGKSLQEIEDKFKNKKNASPKV